MEGTRMESLTKDILNNILSEILDIDKIQEAVDEMSIDDMDEDYVDRCKQEAEKMIGNLLDKL